ncbi:hypothetical protein M3Y99_00799400 [Aphelenchoides fujianensis]|nr:hypothetical protein M3Y99_00799400 [Aphelenchoides fujianensis]
MDEQAPNGESTAAEPTAEPAEEQPEPIDEQGDAHEEEGDETYRLCLQKKVAPELAREVVDLFGELSLTSDDFDERVIEQLATFSLELGKYVVKELRESKLYGVQNKPQYLMSVFRTLKERTRSLGSQQAIQLPLIPGPPVEKIQEIIDRTGYKLEVTVGQRKYHAPPDYNGPDPTSHGYEIYIGQIPRDVYEDQLIPLFETVGPIYDLRLMMDPTYGRSRGYAFLLYCEKEHASEAAKKYDGHEIQSGKQLKVNVSVANRRLFLGNIPKSKSKEEILEELKKHPELEGVTDVIIYSTPDAAENRKNRGFCFVDFADHKAASDAKRRLANGKVRPWNGDLVVDWAEQQDEPDEETMAQVKVLYVKNLKEAVTEEQLTEMFAPHGEIDRVKKIRDYAFVHYKERESALKAMEAMKGIKIEDVDVEISLAKPQVDNKMKKKMPMKRGMPMDRPMGGGGGYGNRSGPPRGRPNNYGGGPGGYSKPYNQYPPSANYDYPPQPAYGGYQGYSQPTHYYPPVDPYAAAGYPPADPYGVPQGYYASAPTAYGGMPGGYGGGGGVRPGPYGRGGGGMGGGGMGGPRRGGPGPMGMGGRGKRRGENVGGGPASKRGGRQMM